LIGLAFDGNWEAMSGDIAYEPIFKEPLLLMFVMFCLIDKYAGAKNIIDD